MGLVYFRPVSVFTRFVLVLLLFFSTVSQSNALLVFDLDDTVWATNEVHGGAFGTRRYLFRVEHTGTALARIPQDLPLKIAVSPADYHYLVIQNQLLAAGEQKIGSFRRYKLEDGTSIVPGFYYIDPMRTYERFREAPKGKNFLLEDFKTAESADPTLSFMLPSWHILVAALSTKTTAEQVVIASVRGHSRTETMAFFRYLRRQGYIEFLPREESIFMLSHPTQQRLRTESADPFKAKTVLIRELVTHLRDIPLLSTDTAVMHPFGAKHPELPIHELHYFEDNHDAHIEARDLMIRLARSGQYPVKMGISFTGLESHFRQIKNRYQPRSAIIQPDGTFRKATVSELLGVSETVLGGLKCGKALIKQLGK